jgi:hypothetical protein
MNNYKEGSWVSVEWGKVYPPFKGTVMFCTEETVCVNYLGLGREVPKENVKQCEKPKRKNERKSVHS